jgi:hypothetical protein
MFMTCDWLKTIKKVFLFVWLGTFTGEMDFIALQDKTQFCSTFQNVKWQSQYSSVSSVKTL